MYQVPREGSAARQSLSLGTEALQDCSLDLSQASTPSQLRALSPSPKRSLKNDVDVIRLSNLGNALGEEECEPETDQYVDYVELLGNGMSMSYTTLLHFSHACLHASFYRCHPNSVVCCCADAVQNNDSPGRVK